MKFFKLFKKFENAEDGAVTVDWVVLTAAIVGLGIAVVTAVSGGLQTAAGDLVSDLGTTMTAATTMHDAPAD